MFYYENLDYKEIAEEIAEEAKKLCPVDTGLLKDSIFVERFGGKPYQYKIVSYIYYAIYVHEMDNKHPNGGQAKFLEEAAWLISEVYEIPVSIELDIDHIAVYLDDEHGELITGAPIDKQVKEEENTEKVMSQQDYADYVKWFNQRLREDRLRKEQMQYDKHSAKYRDYNIMIDVNRTW